jgi:hypothetical protein
VVAAVHIALLQREIISDSFFSKKEGKAQFSRTLSSGITYHYTIYS